MNKIGIGMIGAGFIGQMHSLTFGSVGVARREPSLSGRLIALADTNLDLAREVQERYGWERISTDWRQTIDDPGITIFINSSPNDAHAEPTVAAAAANKHLFSEKPLARTADEAFTIWQAARAAGVQHMCAFIHRFIPALQLARRMIADGEIGRIRHFRSNFLIDMQHPDGSLS